jgi:hypothetical protein
LGWVKSKKEEKNDKLSFSKTREGGCPNYDKWSWKFSSLKVAIPGSKSNTIKNEGSAKERSNYTGEFPADNALELESKSSESNQSHAHMEDLNVN